MASVAISLLEAAANAVLSAAIEAASRDEVNRPTLPMPGVPGSKPGTGSDVGESAGDLSRSRSRSRERECKCPPQSGQKMRRNHSMNPEPREYQARITGFEYGIIDGRTGWNMEWVWLNTDFDGFKACECLLQEAKGNYDQFFDKKGDVKPFFLGFDDMAEQIETQGVLVLENPPSKLMWYFQTPKTYSHMQPVLTASRVSSIYQP